VIDRKTGTNGTFAQVGTAAATATSWSDTTVSAGNQYYYTVAATNAIGTSAASNQASVTVPSSNTLVNFASGFAGATGLTLNGSAAISGANLVLTSGGLYQAASAFTTSAVSTATFSTQFNFQLLNATADGFTFTLQNDSPTALGGVGDELGYGADGFTGGHPAITNSVAIAFGLDSDGKGNSSIGLYVNGATPLATNSVDLTSSGINLHSGDMFSAAITYNGTSLTVTITDLQTGATATQVYQVNIASTIGSSNAYVGFTAGTGALTANQSISSWTFT
jgi:hypothetical protein